jgi:hypothetical protein
MSYIYTYIKRPHTDLGGLAIRNKFKKLRTLETALVMDLHASKALCPSPFKQQI